MQFIKNLLPIVLLLGLSFFAIQPLFGSGFFPMHDDTQVARVFVMHNTLAEGVFPVRWVADLGYNYGYPLFNFYAPLAYYVGGFLAFFVDVLTATKYMMALGVVLAGVGMYLFAKPFWGKLGGIIAGLLYVYAPYHAVNIYVRGAVAEFWAYAFVPFAFWGIYNIYRHCEQSEAISHNMRLPRRLRLLAMTQEMWIWISVAAVSYAAIIISHNLTAMMITPFFILFTLFLFLQKNLHKRSLLILPFVLALLLSAFYWLPVPAEMKYTNVLSQVGGGADYKDHFVCVQQLWESPWAYGGSTHDCVDGLSFRVGKLHIALALLGFLSIFFLWRIQRDKVGIVLFTVLSLFFALFLMLPQSQFLWDTIHPMAFFQYPWRFLLIVAFTTSFLGGASIFVIRKLLRDKFSFIVWIIAAGIMWSIIAYYTKVFVPQIIGPKTVNDYTNKEVIRWETSKLSYEYLPKGFQVPKKYASIPTQKIQPQKEYTIISLQEYTQGLRAVIDAKKQTRLLLSYAYFPALHVFIDKKEVGYTYSEKGIFVTVPKGKHIVEVQFKQTPIEIAGNILSLTGVLLVITGIISTRRKRNDAKKTT